VIAAAETNPDWVCVRRVDVPELAMEILLFVPAGQRDAAGMLKSSAGK